MLQETIGQRLKFLMDSLNLKVRTFASALDVSETNIRNYITRDSKPSSDILERIVQQYPNVNALWLISGQGDPFLPGTDEPLIIYQKNNSGQRIKNNHGTATNNSYTIADCEKERDTYKAERDSLAKEIELLRQQLMMAQALLEAKEETLSLLRAGHNRPN